MSTLKALIEKYCPEGFEWKTLEEITLNHFRGSGVVKDQIGSGDTPCIRFVEVYMIYDIWIDKCVSCIDKRLIKKPKYIEYGDIVFATTSQVLDVIGKCCAYLGQEKALAGSDTLVIKHNQNPKYLAYALSTEKSKQQKMKLSTNSAITHLNFSSLKRLRIPVPPIEVQEKIAEILDVLRIKCRDLKAEIKEEIKNREEQYEHYRDLIIKLGGGLSLIHKFSIPVCFLNARTNVQDFKFSLNRPL